jgi:hypothetical protein
MRRLLSLLAVLVFPLVLSSCDALNSAQQQLNIVNVKFSSPTPASSGPSIGGPTISQATQELLPSPLGGGETVHQVEGEYYLVDTFFVTADNSGNSQAAIRDVFAEANPAISHQRA